MTPFSPTHSSTHVAAHAVRAPLAAHPPRTPTPSPSFADLGLSEPFLRALHDERYEHPTPIQAQAIPHLLAGRDLLGCARTGTGKTAAFALPILQRLSTGRVAHRGVRALVLVPTRELAAQVADSFERYGRRSTSSVAVVYGGVGQTPQVRALSRGVDIVVATPGRLLDLMGQGHARLGQVEVLVLDEADHMLDMGFIPDVRKILAAIPKRRQTLLFSATMPTPIERLAASILTEPIRIQVAPPASTVETLDQCVHFVDSARKPEALAKLLSDAEVRRALVFTRTKRGADRVVKRLVQDRIPAEAIHGNKSQNARERSLLRFRRGDTRVLVATDIAARGIDVDEITHVVNYDLPHVPETYIHRIGRTARAGAGGKAISLCGGEERSLLRDIEALIRVKIRVESGAPSTAHAPLRSAGHGVARGAGLATGHAARPKAWPAPQPHAARGTYAPKPVERRERHAPTGTRSEHHAATVGRSERSSATGSHANHHHVRRKASTGGRRSGKSSYRGWAK
jgi:ATP-dependent RNA helicase RhlE